MAQKGIIINTNTAGHVDASDFAKLIKGLGNDEAYILDTGDDLTITKVSDNEIKISAGMIVMSNGVPIRIEDEEVINIPSGTLGYKRYSLVIAEYKKDGVEVGTDSCTIKVINGDSSQSNPTKPTLIKTETQVQDEICAVLVDGTTADIDSKIDVAGVKNAAKNNSNPNLLINSDFKINQRGLTSYTAKTDKAVYTVDRWRMSLTNGCKTTVNSDGTVTFTVTMDDYSVSLLQEVEDYDLNNVYTFSVKFKGDDKVYTMTNTLGEGFDKVIKGTISLKMLKSDNGNVIVAITQSGAGSYTLEWTKLELGNQATAYRSKNYSQEYIDCCRYFFSPISSIRILPASAGTTTSNFMAYCNNQFPTIMREAPTFSYNKLYNYAGTAISTKISSQTLNADCLSSIYLAASVTAYTYRIDAATFDAELY